MKIMRYVILLTTFFLLGCLHAENKIDSNHINYNRYSVIGKSRVKTGFKLIVFENKDIFNNSDFFQEIATLNPKNLQNRYKVLATISDNNIVNYYWDDQVMTMVSNEVSYKFLEEILKDRLQKNFFVVVLNDKIIYCGVVATAHAPFEIPYVILPNYLVSYGENIRILQLTPFDPGKLQLDRMWYFSDFTEADKKKIMLPELYDYFEAQGKIVKGEFPFSEMKIEEPIK